VLIVRSLFVRSCACAALHIAASEGHLGVLELLLLAKANVHLEDRWQKTALAAAVEFKQEAAVQLLKTHGAVLNENDKASLALLLCEAASKNDLDAIKRLSLSGVSVSVSDYDKRTPLHIAAAEGVRARAQAPKTTCDHVAD